jgi:hypothetical protein
MYIWITYCWDKMILTRQQLAPDWFWSKTHWRFFAPKRIYCTVYVISFVLHNILKVFCFRWVSCSICSLLGTWESVPGSALPMEPEDEALKFLFFATCKKPWRSMSPRSIQTFQDDRRASLPTNQLKKTIEQKFIKGTVQRDGSGPN